MPRRAGGQDRPVILCGGRPCCATAANAHDITQAAELLHGEEIDVLADSGYRGMGGKRGEVKERHSDVHWSVATMPSKRQELEEETSTSAILAEILEKFKAEIRAKVEHSFRVLKCQFGYRKERYRGLAKNTAQQHTLFALVNLWLVCKHSLLHEQAWVRPESGKPPERGSE